MSKKSTRFKENIHFIHILFEFKGLGIRESNPCALCLLNFRTTVFSGFARRQPCFTLQKQPSENFPAHRVCELKKSKFFARKGKSAVNSISINEHFNALLRKICLFEPHGIRLPYACVRTALKQRQPLQGVTNQAHVLICHEFIF